MSANLLRDRAGSSSGAVSVFRPLLNELRRSGCKIGLISNTEATLTSYDLEKLNIRDAFDAIVLSSEIGIRKPDNRIFAEGLRALGTEALEHRGWPRPEATRLKANLAVLPDPRG